MAKSKATKEPGGSRLARLAALLRSPAGRAARTALLGAVAVLAMSLVVRQARGAVHRMPSYRIRSGDVVFTDLPPIVDDRMRAALRGYLQASLPADAEAPGPLRDAPCTFDPDVERRLRDLVARHPMVRSVEDLEVRFPREVRVRATLRMPVAILRASWSGGVSAGQLYDMPVDVDGVVLDPGVYGKFLTECPAVVVTGVRASCPGVGLRWLDREDQVAEAISVAKVANRLNAQLPHLGFPRVAFADVSGFTPLGRFRGPGEVVLLLEDGRRVVWGRTERDLVAVVGEDGFDVKLERLLRLLEARGGREPATLDVRFPLRS